MRKEEVVVEKTTHITCDECGEIVLAMYLQGVASHDVKTGEHVVNDFCHTGCMNSYFEKHRNLYPKNKAHRDVKVFGKEEM